MMIKWMGASACVVAALAVGGCSSGSGAAHKQQATTPVSASAPNPVTMLQRLDGCVLEAGAKVGDVDMDGNRYASCDYQDNGAGGAGTDVTVYTAAGVPTAIIQPDDNHKVIVGPHFIAEVTGDWSSYSASFDVDSVAQALGGKVSAPTQ